MSASWECPRCGHPEYDAQPDDHNGTMMRVCVACGDEWPEPAEGWPTEADKWSSYASCDVCGAAPTEPCWSTRMHHQDTYSGGTVHGKVPLKHVHRGRPRFGVTR